MMTDSRGRLYDELLVTLARTGDRAAGERLAARWQPRLMRTARRLLQDEEQAREAVQETWAGICRGWIGLHDTARFPAWAFGILHRKCADRIRSEQAGRGRHGVLNGTEAAPTGSPEDGAAIRQAVAGLSPAHRIAALLFFGEGLTLAEIASATGVPLGTAKSRIFHARRQLKAALTGDDQ